MPISKLNQTATTTKLTNRQETSSSLRGHSFPQEKPTVQRATAQRVGFRQRALRRGGGGGILPSEVDSLAGLFLQKLCRTASRKHYTAKLGAKAQTESKRSRLKSHRGTECPVEPGFYESVTRSCGEVGKDSRHQRLAKPGPHPRAGRSSTQS